MTFPTFGWYSFHSVGTSVLTVSYSTGISRVTSTNSSPVTSFSNSWTASQLAFTLWLPKGPKPDKEQTHTNVCYFLLVLTIHTVRWTHHSPNHRLKWFGQKCVPYNLIFQSTVLVEKNESIYEGQQRLYFLRKLNAMHIDRNILICVPQFICKKVLWHLVLFAGGEISQSKTRDKLNRIYTISCKIAMCCGVQHDTSLEQLYK